MSDQQPVFQDDICIDVTFFSAGPGEVMGYMAGAVLRVYEDGTIMIEAESEEPEIVHKDDILRMNDNVNNYNPDNLLDIRWVTNDKGFLASFKSPEAKSRFLEALKR